MGQVSQTSRFSISWQFALYLGEMLIWRSVALRTVCSSNAVTEQKGRRRREDWGVDGEGGGGGVGRG